jgi:hypothetical protein
VFLGSFLVRFFIGGRGGDIHHTTAIFTAALTAAFSAVGITGDIERTEQRSSVFSVGIIYSLGSNF